MYSNSTVQVTLSAVLFICVIGVPITLSVVCQCMQRCSLPPEDERGITALFPQCFRNRHASSHASLVLQMPFFEFVSFQNSVQCLLTRHSPWNKVSVIGEGAWSVIMSGFQRPCPSMGGASEA